jgi:hypothetical protein
VGSRGPGLFDSVNLKNRKIADGVIYARHVIYLRKTRTHEGDVTYALTYPGPRGA